MTTPRSKSDARSSTASCWPIAGIAAAGSFRANVRAGLQAVPGRKQAGGRRLGASASVPEGEQQRLHRDCGCDLSDVAAIPALWGVAGQGDVRSEPLSYGSSPSGNGRSRRVTGCYPQANRQVYGGGEYFGGKPDAGRGKRQHDHHGGGGGANGGPRGFCGPLLAGDWEIDHGKEKGFDPENQLCTDDFAGHLAHNVNLSGKAIIALGAYGKLCRMRTEKAQAAIKGQLDAAAREYGGLARELAARWLKKVFDDGDHFRLAFDKPGTWSQSGPTLCNGSWAWTYFRPKRSRRKWNITSAWPASMVCRLTAASLTPRSSTGRSGPRR